MKKLKNLPLLLCALLLTIAGAALPYTVSVIQDARVEAAPEIRPFDPVSLTLQKGGGVQETLELLAGSYSDLEWSGKTELTAAEAANAAREAVRLLNENGLLSLTPEDFGLNQFVMSLDPHIMMSMNESSLSAVVWICWIDAAPDNWIFIDDATGKMVRAFLLSAAPNIELPGKTNTAMVYDSTSLEEMEQEEAFKREEVFKRAEVWRQFLSDYYGIELSFRESETVSDSYSAQFTLLFDNCKVLLEITVDGTAYFNP